VGIGTGPMDTWRKGLWKPHIGRGCLSPISRWRSWGSETRRIRVQTQPFSSFQYILHSWNVSNCAVPLWPASHCCPWWEGEPCHTVVCVEWGLKAGWLLASFWLTRSIDLARGFPVPNSMAVPQSAIRREGWLLALCLSWKLTGYNFPLSLPPSQMDWFYLETKYIRYLNLFGNKEFCFVVKLALLRYDCIYI
jgi:hypothetical protein